MRRFLFENGLSVFFLTLFLASLAGQSFVGQRAHNAEEVAHGGTPISWFDYVLSPSFGGAVLENWQSEFLQFTLFILATVWLIQRGSNKSKKPEDIGLESDEKQLMADTREMIALLARLRRAPLVDPYSGPAILSGRAF